MSVYIHGGLRSPIGVLNGQYKHMRPEILGAQLIDQLIKRHTISQVDGIFVATRLALVVILVDLWDLCVIYRILFLLLP